MKKKCRACRAKTKRGEPCRAPEIEASGFCFFHSPAKAKERAKARRKGGLSFHHGTSEGGRTGVSIREVSDVLNLLEEAASDVLARRPSLSRARALVYLSLAALKVVEAGPLEERITALERRAEEAEENVRKGLRAS